MQVINAVSTSQVQTKQRHNYLRISPPLTGLPDPHVPLHRPRHTKHMRQVQVDRQPAQRRRSPHARPWLVLERENPLCHHALTSLVKKATHSTAI